MAIYTQYGRYQKAKLFKEMLESAGDTYMLLGLGNPYWDLDDKNQPIPVAPYDITHITDPDNSNDNQFYDNHVNQYFSKIGYNPISTVIDGEPQEDTHASVCKDLIPPFPCVWHDANNNDPLISDTAIMQNDYQNYYIESSNSFTDFTLHTYTNDIPDTIYWPSDNYERQFFSELVLRGYAQSACSSPSLIKHPAGLLGAVKVSISFVKDIGTTLDNTDNSIDQFWYGDRYWEVVDPNEDTLESYIDGTINKVYPHHLLFSATINPRQLFANNLNIDQNLIPRQIALYSKKLTPTVDGNDVVYEHGPNSYRVGDYVFNFGQYTISDINDIISADAQAKILNFTFPCSLNTSSRSDSNSYPQGDFKFILNDYIKGTIRNRHSVDRIGYIVGF